MLRPGQARGPCTGHAWPQLRHHWPGLSSPTCGPSVRGSVGTRSSGSSVFPRELRLWRLSFRHTASYWPGALQQGPQGSPGAVGTQRDGVPPEPGAGKEGWCLDWYLEGEGLERLRHRQPLSGSHLGPHALQVRVITPAGGEGNGSERLKPAQGQQEGTAEPSPVASSCPQSPGPCLHRAAWHHSVPSLRDVFHSAEGFAAQLLS